MITALYVAIQLTAMPAIPLVPVFAEGPATPSLPDRLLTADYEEDRLFVIAAAPGMVTDIMLETAEAVLGIAGGDSVRWPLKLMSSGHGKHVRRHLLVRPEANAAVTNLVVLTTRRTYRLLLEPGTPSAPFAYAWRYGSEAPIDPALVAHRFDYRVEVRGGAIRPEAVYDDGARMLIRMPERLAVMEAPLLFAVGDKGAVELINYRLIGRTYVVDRLAPVIELRRHPGARDVVRITRQGTGV